MSAYRWGLLISFVTDLYLQGGLLYANIQIYIPDTDNGNIYYRSFNKCRMNKWSVIQTPSNVQSYGYE